MGEGRSGAQGGDHAEGRTVSAGGFGAEDLVGTGRRPLHFTIGTGLGFDEADNYSVETELGLVKVALLYADRARLFSPGVSAIMHTRGLENLKTPQQRRGWLVDYFTMQILSNPYKSPIAHLLPNLGMLARSKDTDRAVIGRVVKNNLHRILGDDFDFGDDDWEQRAREMWGIGEHAGADGLVEARDAGLLEIHRFEEDEAAGWADSGADRRAAKTLSFVRLIAAAMTDGNTHPLFDDQAGTVARTLTEEGAALPEDRLLAGKKSALAADLIGRLPTFEAAPVGQVLEVRRELERPLVSFRGAVSGFAEEIRGAGWDPGFPAEAEHVFVKRVEPAVVEIEEAIESNADLRVLASKLFRPKEIGRGLGVGIASLSVVPDVVSLLLGVGVTAGSTIRETYKEHVAYKEALEANQMFFYHRAGERLGGP